MEDKIREILGDLLSMDSEAVGESTSSQNVEDWDSLRHVEIVAALEQEFDVILSVDDIEAMTSFTSIVERLKDRVS